MSVQALTLDGFKLILATAIGPSTTVPVSAGAAANVDLTISPPPAIIQGILAINSVTGLPDGIVLVGVSYPTLSTVRIRVLNHATTTINITANSVTAVVLCKAN